MRVLNAFSIGASANPGLVQLPRPVTFQDGHCCQRLRTETKITISTTNASPYNLTNADLLSLCRKTFTAITLQFGDKSTDIVDNAMSFDQYRLLSWMMTGRDVLVGQPGTVNMVELNSYPVTNIAVPGSGSVTITIELPRHFLYEGFGAVHVDDWCPGATQMRQIQFQFTSTAATWNADATRSTASGTINVTWIVDEAETPYDRWASPPRVFLTNQSALELKQATGGVLLGCAEMTAGGYSTSLGVFSLQAKNKPDVHTMIQASRLVNESPYLVPEGGLNPQTLATILFQPDRNADISDLPCSDEFTFKAAAQDLSPFQLFWLIVPRVTESYADDIVRQNTNHGAQNGKGTTLLAVNEFTLSNKPYATGYAAVSPIALLPPDHSAFSTASGRYWEGSNPTITHVPKFIQDATAAAIHAVGGPGSPAAASTLAAQTVATAASVPGASSASGLSTPKHLEIAAHIAPAAARHVGSSIGGVIRSVLSSSKQ